MLGWGVTEDGERDMEGERPQSWIISLESGLGCRCSCVGREL